MIFIIPITCLLNSVLILWRKVSCRCFTVLLFGSQVIAVILAAFLQQANGRAITSTSQYNIEGMLDLVGEELNTADVLRLSEPDSASYEVFSSDNMTQPKEASPVLRHKRSLVGPCYTGNFQTVRLASGGLQAFPICRKRSLGCASSLSTNQQNKILCVASLTTVLVREDDDTNRLRVFAQSCSCAAWNHTSRL